MDDVGTPQRGQVSTLAEPKGKETERDNSPQEAGPESVVEQWLLKQDYKTKLACVILSNYGIADHNTEKLAQKIRSHYEAEVKAMANNPDDSLSPDEVLMTGLAAEGLIWQKNL